MPVNLQHLHVDKYKASCTHQTILVMLIVFCGWWPLTDLWMVSHYIYILHLFI